MPVVLNRSRATGLLDMTPMLDMVFNLLIFFMVVSQFANDERDMRVLLPDGTEAMPLTATPRQIFINIDENGGYSVRGQEFTAESLAGLLAEAAADNPTQSVVIRADRRVPWDYVATAMRLCNESGLRDYSASLSDEK